MPSYLHPSVEGLKQAYIPADAAPARKTSVTRIVPFEAAGGFGHDQVAPGSRRSPQAAGSPLARQAKQSPIIPSEISLPQAAGAFEFSADAAAYMSAELFSADEPASVEAAPARYSILHAVKYALKEFGLLSEMSRVCPN